jgi:hypothetical protein
MPKNASCPLPAVPDGWVAVVSGVGEAATVAVTAVVAVGADAEPPQAAGSAPRSTRTTMTTTERMGRPFLLPVDRWTAGNTGTRCSRSPSADRCDRCGYFNLKTAVTTDPSSILAVTA